MDGRRPRAGARRRRLERSDPSETYTTDLGPQGRGESCIRLAVALWAEAGPLDAVGLTFDPQLELRLRLEAGAGAGGVVVPLAWA